MYRQKNNIVDTCVIRTHAPEGTALAGQRVNHSYEILETLDHQNWYWFLPPKCLSSDDYRDKTKFI